MMLKMSPSIIYKSLSDFSQLFWLKLPHCIFNFFFFHKFFLIVYAVTQVSLT